MFSNIRNIHVYLIVVDKLKVGFGLWGVWRLGCLVCLRWEVGCVETCLTGLSWLPSREEMFFCHCLIVNGKNILYALFADIAPNSCLEKSCFNFYFFFIKLKCLVLKWICFGPAGYFCQRFQHSGFLQLPQRGYGPAADEGERREEEIKANLFCAHGLRKEEQHLFCLLFEEGGRRNSCCVHVSRRERQVLIVHFTILWDHVCMNSVNIFLYLIFLGTKSTLIKVDYLHKECLCFFQSMPWQWPFSSINIYSFWNITSQENLMSYNIVQHLREKSKVKDLIFRQKTLHSTMWFCEILSFKNPGNI